MPNYVTNEITIVSYLMLDVNNLTMHAPCGATVRFLLKI